MPVYITDDAVTMAENRDWLKQLLTNLKQDSKSKHQQEETKLQVSIKKTIPICNIALESYSFFSKHIRIYINKF